MEREMAFWSDGCIQSKTKLPMHHRLSREVGFIVLELVSLTLARRTICAKLDCKPSFAELAAYCTNFVSSSPPSTSQSSSSAPRCPLFSLSNFAHGARGVSGIIPPSEIPAID